MDEKQLELLLDGVAAKHKDSIKLEVEAAVKGLVTSEQLAEKFESVTGIEKSITEINEAIEKQGLYMQKLEQSTKSEKTLEEGIAEKSEDLAKIIANRVGKVSLHLPINKTDVTRASVTNHTLAYRLPDIGEIAYAATKMEQIFNSGSVGPNSNGVIRYVDQSAVTRNAAETAEAAVKPESAITWQEYTLPIEKIADTIPITMEAANDVAFMSSEIRNFLLNNLRLRLDNQLYDGDGVTPNIHGIYTDADTFTPAASGIGGANIYDLILKVQEDIVDGSQYSPNVALVSYADYNEMLLTKEATTNAYINPGWASSIITGGQPEMNVNGIRVIPSAAVTANTMVVGDFNFATIYNLGGITLDMGWIDKQFVENMMTLRAERRLGMLVRTAHTDAFRKVTDVDAALTTLAT
jgi:HK97 family phage major capsid protein